MQVALLIFKLKRHITHRVSLCVQFLMSLAVQLLEYLFIFQQLSSKAPECALFIFCLEISQGLKENFIKTFWGAFSLFLSFLISCSSKTYSYWHTKHWSLPLFENTQIFILSSFYIVYTTGDSDTMASQLEP